jgi:putative ABC transport system permease protein
MSPTGLVWANLRRRPTHTLLTLAAVTFAFMLHGLALGIAEGFRHAALAHNATLQPSVLVLAVGISAIGMTLILFLTTNAMAHSIRLRTHELALMKALGFSHRRILALLVAEAAVPCLTGAVLGLIGGKALFAWLVVALPALAVVPAPVYTAPILVAALVLALIVAVLSATIPAARIARTDVAALMRGNVPVPRSASAGAGAPRHGTEGLRVSGSDSGQRFNQSTDLLLLRQIVVATRIGLSTLPLRLKGALLIVTSVGAVVFVLVSILSTGEGVRVSMLSSGDPSTVMLRSRSTVLLDQSRVPDDLSALMIDAPGVARARDGTPLIDSELFAWVGLVKRNNGENGYAMLAGVGPLWPEMTPKFRLLSGRLPRPGSRELIAGELATRKFSDLDDGTVLRKGELWRIVGTFTTHGWWDGYLVSTSADLKAVEEPSVGSAVRVRLSSPQAFSAFRDSVAARLPPSVTLERETDYYAGFWRRVPKHLAYMALVIGILISAGASLGTALVMHNALDDRRQEIAMLRLIGFDSMAVAASVLIEGLCLCIVGSLLGTGLAWLWLDGLLYNGAWNVFRVSVDSVMFGLGICWGVGIAITGTIPLALRTLRQSALDAIHDLFSALREAWAVRANAVPSSFVPARAE